MNQTETLTYCVRCHLRTLEERIELAREKVEVRQRCPKCRAVTDLRVVDA